MEKDYRQFTGPAELHKAINMLRGIVSGIAIDSTIQNDEISELAHWCELHGHLRDRHPFSEILPVVENALSDGVITEEESKDILWVCSSFAASGKYYDEITSSIQFLSGMIHGMMADHELSDEEIKSLHRWIQNNDFLVSTYPFDEINSLLSSILADHVITDDERNTLLAFLSTVIEFKDSLNLTEQEFINLRQTYSICGICASCPDISFTDKIFCFTGEFLRGTRKEIAAKVEALGAKAKSAVSGKTDYLVVGNSGNPCWAYACYGRKIEEAMEFRKKGSHIIIVNETDFWDAVDDAEAGIE
jgi:hypothetical protein